MTFKIGEEMGNHVWNGEHWVLNPNCLPWTPDNVTTLSRLQAELAADIEQRKLRRRLDAAKAAININPAAAWPTGYIPDKFIRKPQSAADAWWEGEDRALKARVAISRRVRIRARIYNVLCASGRNPYSASLLATDVIDILKEEGVL
jgi:hypothetical protein